jgi:hypothetical protein
LEQGKGTYDAAIIRFEVTEHLRQNVSGFDDAAGWAVAVTLAAFPSTSCLSELGYLQVWQQLTAGLAGLSLVEPTSSALRQARQRLGSAPMRALFDLLRGPAATSAVHAVRWRGLLLTAIDGTMLSVADSAANLRRYRKARGNHGGSGYPVLRLSALLTCGTRSVIDAVFDPLGTSELDQARRRRHIEAMGRRGAGSASSTPGLRGR